MARLTLHLESLRYRAQDPPVLSECFVNLEAGDISLVLGASGSGKTSLLLSLCGAIPYMSRFDAAVCSGYLVLGGNATINIDRFTVSSLWSLSGVLFQYPDHNFITTNVLDEFSFAARLAGIDYSEAADRIASTIEFLQLSRHLHRRVDQLSDGLKQLVALGSLFIKQPRFLFLDEPTAMLDPESLRAFLTALSQYREICPDSVVVIATHSPESFRSLRPNRLLTIRHGKVSEHASFDEAINTVSGGTHSASNIEKPVSSSINEDLIVGRLLAPYYRDRDFPVCAGLNLKISRGSLVVMTGRNGSGKTTICRTLSGLHQRYHGELWFRGCLYRDKKPSVPDEVAYVPQLPITQFMEESVQLELDLLGGGRERLTPEAKSVLESALSAFHIDRDADPLILSFGQQKLLSLLCYLNFPQILFLDEPLVCLDRLQQQIVEGIIELYLSQGTAIVVATHEPNALRSLSHSVVHIGD